MKARSDNSESFGESPGTRGEDFWHSVWKGIESIPRDDAQQGEVSLQAPRDYVVDSENRSLARLI